MKRGRRCRFARRFAQLRQPRRTWSEVQIGLPEDGTDVLPRTSHPHGAMPSAAASLLIDTAQQVTGGCGCRTALHSVDGLYLLAECKRRGVVTCEGGWL